MWRWLQNESLNIFTKKKSTVHMEKTTHLASSTKQKNAIRQELWSKTRTSQRKIENRLVRKNLGNISRFTIFFVLTKSIFKKVFHYRKCKQCFTLKWMGVNLAPLPVVFRKMYLLKRGLKPWSFATFNIIISYTFPKNFLKIPEVAQEIWRMSLSILPTFIDFLWFFVIFSLQRN